MNATAESARARRYLLGAVTEDERATIEQDYFEDEDALDRVAAAEDELIEDYLADRLSPNNRRRFEQGYLAAPGHCARVETVRRLIARGAGQPAHQPIPAERPRLRSSVSLTWLAAAASVVLVASAALWLWTSLNRPKPFEVAAQPARPSAPTGRQRSAPASSPRVFALTISPVGVRGAASDRAVVIPQGTERVTIRLGRDVDTMAMIDARASIRVVGAEEVWQGLLTPATGSDAIGGLELAAAQLRAEDYVVAVHGTTRDGRQQSVRYFLRIREP